LHHCQQDVELREVVLKDKPSHMLQVSPKGTVPVLILSPTDLTQACAVIDESIDVMRWAISQNPNGWAPLNNALIIKNDQEFKPWLDKYKYADRHTEHPPSYYREQVCKFFSELNQLLSQQHYLCGDTFGFDDAAIIPFIRQAAFVDKTWFDQSPYSDLQRWLTKFLDSPRFEAVMQKHPQWKAPESN
jgi:glutathione S-transferase